MSREIFNLAQHCIARAAASTPDKTALIVVGDVDRPQTAERWTYAALDRAVRGVAAGLLANGLSPGDRIMLRLPNSSDYALMFYGSIAAGMVRVPTIAMRMKGNIAPAAKGTGSRDKGAKKSKKRPKIKAPRRSSV